MAKSPTAQAQLDKLAKEGWSITFGKVDGGSSTNAHSIVIDGSYKSAPLFAAQTLAHELGHAMYKLDGNTPDASSRSAYVEGQLANEGAATMNNIAVQREIMAAGGPGIAGDPMNWAAYNRVYDQFLRDGNVAAARASVGSIYGAHEVTSTTHQPYAKYYGDCVMNTLGKTKACLSALLVAIPFFGEGCASSQVIDKRDPEMAVNNEAPSIWEVIEGVSGPDMTRHKVKKVLGAKLEEESRTKNGPYHFYTSPAIPLAGGVIIDEAQLRVPPNSEVAKILILRLAGSCVGRRELRAHFHKLKLTEAPHGHSLDEAGVFSEIRPWGSVSFGFKERNPDCIAFAVLSTESE